MNLMNYLKQNKFLYPVLLILDGHTSLENPLALESKLPILDVICIESLYYILMFISRKLSVQTDTCLEILRKTLRNNSIFYMKTQRGKKLKTTPNTRYERI